MSRTLFSRIVLTSVLSAGLYTLGGSPIAQAEATNKPAPAAEKSPKPGKPGKPEPGATTEVTLEGEMMCAHCSLHETEQCQSVLKVKDVKYYFTDNAVARDNVEKVCGGGSKRASVTGVVSESKGQKQIAPSSVKLL